MAGDWIKQHRKELESVVFNFSDAKIYKIWQWCKMKANYKEGTFEGVKIMPGQFATGRKVGAKECRVAQGTFYEKLKKLEQIGSITLKANNRFTIVSLCNWQLYNGEESKIQQQSNNNPTTTQQPSNTRERKKERKEGNNNTPRAILLPPAFDTEKCQQTFNRWFDWLDQHGKTMIDPSQSACAACQFFKSPETIERAVNHAIANNYITLKNYKDFDESAATEEPFDLMAEVDKALKK